MKLLKKFNFLFRDYFAFTQTEARGVWVLLVLMSLLLASPLFYKHFLQKQYTAEKQAQDQALLDSLMHQLEGNYQVQETNEPAEESKVIANLYPFDPNTASENTLKLSISRMASLISSPFKAKESMPPKSRICARAIV